MVEIRISARGLNNTDGAQRDPYKKTPRAIFSHCFTCKKINYTTDIVKKKCYDPGWENISNFKHVILVHLAYTRVYSRRL